MKLTFRARLYAGFALVIAVFLCVIGITVTKIEHARADVSAMRDEALMLQLANQWLANIRQNSARSLAVARSPGKDMLVFFKDADGRSECRTRPKPKKRSWSVTKRPTAKAGWTSWARFARRGLQLGMKSTS
jgi:hypothetical protein